MKQHLLMLICALWMLSSVLHAANFEVVIIQSSALEDQSEGLSFAGIATHPRRPVENAAELALLESQPTFKAQGISAKLSVFDIDPTRDIDAQLADFSPQQLLVLDIPATLMTSAIKALANRNLVVVNVRHTETALRDTNCQPHVFHTIPSDRMYFDALGQFLIYRGWRKVLVVRGPQAIDLQRTDALIMSLEKFGASVVDVREYTLSHHPDDRDQNKPEFLTGGASYDVVAVIDTDRDYGRYIQYSTRQPRPVVGDVGLTPRNWHPALERYGAPQLNQRYRDLVNVQSEMFGMTDAEFATWAAIKFVTNTLQSRHLTATGIDLGAIYRDPEGRIDLYKGTRGSFRTWNQQLRQPILLSAESAVIAVAPMPKFLHPLHYMDTLGLDESESQCKLR
jgi:ABC transporter substrate binding protein (PQQ-dependent alcohol dehydrogenase system)